MADSFGLCVFGRSVTDVNRAMIATAINDAFDAGIDAQWLIDIARETLRLEAEFNRRAGFTEAMDELPAFFADEPLPPTNRSARLFAREVNAYMKAFSADPALVIT